MAYTGGGGIIQEIQVILDANYARQMESDLASALERGTNPARARSNLSSVEQGLSQVGSTARSLNNILLQLGAGTSLALLARNVIAANVEFQSLHAQLRAFTGDTDSANQAFDALNELSRKVPFTVRDLTKAYVDLRLVGVNPSIEQMQSFANVAAALQVPIEDVASRTGQATLGMIRGFRSLGIEAKAQGDNLVLTSNGVRTTIRYDAASIVGYLDSVGKNRFGDASALQLNTLGGAWQQFTNTLKRIFQGAGEGGITGLLTDALKATNAWLDSFVGHKADFEYFKSEVKGIGQLIEIVFLADKAIVLTFADAFISLAYSAAAAYHALGAASAAARGDFSSAREEIRLMGESWEQSNAAAQRTKDSWHDVGVAATKATADAKAAKDKLDATPYYLRATTELPGTPGAPTTLIPLQKQTAGDQLAKEIKFLEQLARATQDTGERMAILAVAHGLLKDSIDKGAPSVELMLKRMAELADVERRQRDLTEQLSKEYRKIGEDFLGSADALEVYNARLKDAQYLQDHPHPGGSIQIDTPPINAPGTVMEDAFRKTLPSQAEADALTGDIVKSVSEDLKNSKLDAPQIGFMEDLKNQVDSDSIDIAYSLSERIGGALFQLGRDGMTLGKTLGNVLKAGIGAGLGEVSKLAIGNAAKDWALMQDDQADALRWESQVAAGAVWLQPAVVGAIAAANAHRAGAIKWAALAGGAAAAGGAISSSGGSGGGGSSGGSARPGTDPTVRQPIVHLVVNAFDPKNPVHQQYLGQAIEGYVDRAGGRVVFGGNR